MVRCGIAFCITMLCFSFAAECQVYVGGELTGNETYSPGNNPYIVTQDLIVSNDVTLTILPGVEMQFESGTGLVVNGTLIAKGTGNQLIRFIPKYQTTLPGLWNGIVFNNAKTILKPDSTYSSGSVLSGSIISNASYSVTLDYNTALLIENTRIEQCSFGIYIKASGRNTIRNCTLKNCDFGIFLASGYENPANKIYGNSISGSNDVGIFINSVAGSSNHNFITGNRISSCNIGVHIGNYSNNGAGFNLISGNSFTGNKDALKLFQQSNTVSNNYFMLNRSGILCWQSDNNVITHNLFSRNVQNALTLAAGSSYNNVSYNSLNYNNGAIWIKPDSLRNSLSNSFLYNTVFKNTAFSFQVQNTPQGAVQFNNIFRNGDYQSFKNLSDTIIHAEYNYWGAVSGSSIDSIILDKNDDPQRGEVLYNPILDNILSTAPVPPPEKVIKQRIGNDIVVSWAPEELSDLNGYNLYFGSNDGITFEHSINVGMSTSMNMGTMTIEDTIAVTAVDILADGSNDQTDGYESDYAFARLSPYAGPDTAICFNSVYAINKATAFKYESLTWSTSGDGSFNNDHLINPVYIPGQQDYVNGKVILYLDVQGDEPQSTDSALITFHDAPVAFAGNDTLISIDSAVRLINAAAAGFDYLKWSTSGDGTFDSDTLNNPVYHPGPGDMSAGMVTLAITAFSACGSATDHMVVTIDPGFTLYGRVHAGSIPAPNSNIFLFQEKNGKVQPLRSGLLATDGNFELKALFAGTYYLYAIPDKTNSPGYLPTYYYNDIHWANAHKFVFDANTYDVDINLARLNVSLPAGEGSISGFSSALPGNSGSCGDITVLLYDKQKKNILDWMLVQNGGNFRFKNLPYGNYVLAGEKAGIPYFESQIITLTPGEPTAENIELVCAAAESRFSLSAGFNPGNDSGELSVFPNPVTDVLNISGMNESGTYSIHFINSQGVVKKYHLDVVSINNNFLFLHTLSSGFYIIEVWKEGNCLYRNKLIKN